MTNARWIWANNDETPDTYAEFYFEYDLTKENRSSSKTFQIACETNYTLKINDEIASFSGCADYPHYKLYNEINVDKFLTLGKNKFSIEVWYQGIDSQTCIKTHPGVIFELFEDNKSVYSTSAETLSRPILQYDFGRIKMITGQLGASFRCDLTKKSCEFSKSFEFDYTNNIFKRNIEELVLKPRQNSGLCKKTENSYIYDLGEETAGFFEIEATAAEDSDVLVAYGEHLDDGNVRRLIGDRDFSVEVKLPKGTTKYINTFRRIAGRYLEIFSEKPIEIKYLGIRPVVYPVVKIEKQYQDPLIQKIYDVCVKTLVTSMHEHYEDCPWREQALYAFDSRNQMLAGYTCFKGGNFQYARHNLILISHGLRNDGLLSLCYPAGMDYPIPMFSLAYILEVCEYVEASGDKEILDIVGNTMQTIVNTYKKNLTEINLVKEFAKPFWNFYEWADASSGSIEGVDADKTGYNCILNCMFVHAMTHYKKYFEDDTDLEAIKAAIFKRFYRNGVFVIGDNTELSSRLSCSLATIIGLGNEPLCKKMINLSDNMVDATLSMKAFFYDALLTFGDKFKDVVFSEIKSDYKTMLDDGATTFYEVIEGASAFGNAGSLCHGWSAIPVYYFDKFL